MKKPPSRKNTISCLTPVSMHACSSPGKNVWVIDLCFSRFSLLRIGGEQLAVGGVFFWQQSRRCQQGLVCCTSVPGGGSGEKK